jgi:hypothetical protein
MQTANPVPGRIQPPRDGRQAVGVADGPPKGPGLSLRVLRLRLHRRTVGRPRAGRSRGADGNALLQGAFIDGHLDQSRGSRLAVARAHVRSSFRRSAQPWTLEESRACSEATSSCGASSPISSCSPFSFEARTTLVLKSNHPIIQSYAISQCSLESSDHQPRRPAICHISLVYHLFRFTTTVVLDLL